MNIAYSKSWDLKTDKRGTDILSIYLSYRCTNDSRTGVVS